MLDEELKKPAKKRNYDKIEELTRAYAELMGTETEVRNAMQRCLSELKRKVKPKRKITRGMRVCFTAVSVAMLLFIMNIVTVSAFDMNVFSFIVHVADGSFSVDFSQAFTPNSFDNAIKLPITPDDPYGMIVECAKHEIYPETPHYLPDGFLLVDISFSNSDNTKKYVTFNFINNNQKITFGYDLFPSTEWMQTQKFPNDEHKFNEIKVNKKSALLAKEKKDMQFTFVYCCEDCMMISFSSWNVSESEVNKIINSIY